MNYIINTMQEGKRGREECANYRQIIYRSASTTRTHTIESAKKRRAFERHKNRFKALLLNIKKKYANDVHAAAVIVAFPKMFPLS